jgi:hypothetical protein
MPLVYIVTLHLGGTADMLARIMNAKTLKYSSLEHAAIELRRQGYTFSEIQTTLGSIPKGTLSGWLKNVELTDTQKTRISEIATKAGLAGRQKGAWGNRAKRIERLGRIQNTAAATYPHLVAQPSFLPGLVLYLAEGTKKSEAFQFMNSDPYLIKIMIDWVIQVGGINFSDLRFRLYIHELYAHENCEDFWIKSLGAQQDQLLKTVYKPNGRPYKKNPAYKGCLRIEVRGSELYWKTMAWRDCLYRSIV